MNRKARNKLAWSHLERQVRKESGDFSGPLMWVSDPTGAAPETCRASRVSLFYTVVNARGLVEDDSVSRTKLGGVPARAGKDTSITDRDPRGPAIHEIFGTRNSYGMVNVPFGEHKHSEVWEEPLRVSR